VRDDSDSSRERGLQRWRAMQYTRWFNEALFDALFDASAL